MSRAPMRPNPQTKTPRRPPPPQLTERPAPDMRQSHAEEEVDETLIKLADRYTTRPQGLGVPRRGAPDNSARHTHARHTRATRARRSRRVASHVFIRALTRAEKESAGAHPAAGADGHEHHRLSACQARDETSTANERHGRAVHIYTCTLLISVQVDNAVSGPTATRAVLGSLFLMHW